MTKILYYPETFFLDAMLQRTNLPLCGIDSYVNRHVENFLLLLLVFDRIHLPLDNFVFLSDEVDRVIYSHLLSDKRFRELAELGLVTTTEHGAYDL